MNGTTTQPLGRSVQLAVMAAPSASIADAVAEARRRHDDAGALVSRPVTQLWLRPQTTVG